MIRVTDRKLLLGNTGITPVTLLQGLFVKWLKRVTECRMGLKRLESFQLEI